MTDRCAECSFAWDTPVADGLRIVDRLPAASREAIERIGEDVYRRPEPEVWSANEYIWHLVDAFRMAAEWLHDMSMREHPIHYAVDNDALAAIRGYTRLPVDVGLWSLEQSCRLFTNEAATIPLDRTCYYHDWKDVTAFEVVSFLIHEAVHHLYDLERLGAPKEASYAD